MPLPFRRSFFGQYPFGNAILSRFELAEVRHILLPVYPPDLALGGQPRTTEDLEDRQLTTAHVMLPDGRAIGVRDGDGLVVQVGERGEHVDADGGRGVDRTRSLREKGAERARAQRLHQVVIAAAFGPRRWRAVPPELLCSCLNKACDSVRPSSIIEEGRT